LKHNERLRRSLTIVGTPLKRVPRALQKFPDRDGYHLGPRLSSSLDVDFGGATCSETDPVAATDVTRFN